MESAQGISICFVFQDNNIEVNRLLKSLTQIDLGNCVDIIAIDNFSRDNKAICDIQALKQISKFEHVNVQTIKNEKREPLPYNRNLCWKNSSGNIILFIDSDVEFIQEDFLNLIEINFTSQGCDLIAPLIYGPHEEIQSLGLKRFHNIPYIFRFCRNSSVESDVVDMIHGACFGVKKKVFHDVGGFDEAMSPYNFDEMDFAIRAKLKNFVIKAFNNIQIRHYSGGTTGRFKQSERAFYFVRHAIRSIRKNYSTLHGIFVTLFFIGAASLQVLMGSKSYYGANVVIRSIVWNLQNSIINQ